MKTLAEQRQETMNLISREAARENTNMVALWSLIHRFVTLEHEIIEGEFYSATQEEE